MKFRPIPAVIALLLGGLVCYGYIACGAETAITVIATVVALLFLVSVLGIGFTTGPNRTVLFSTVSSIVNALAVIGWLFALYAALSGNVKNQKS